MRSAAVRVRAKKRSALPVSVRRRMKRMLRVAHVWAAVMAQASTVSTARAPVLRRRAVVVLAVAAAARARSHGVAR